MKRICLFAFMLALLPMLLLAQEMPVGPQRAPIATPQGISTPSVREAPAYTFTKLPTSIITNYYDYMIGAYNNMPLRVIPQSADGGYFMTYHGRRQATATRRVFYTYIDSAGNIVNNSEITSVQNHEGFSAMDIDPVSAKPLYAWHANADADANLEVQFTSDAFLGGIAGLFNDITVAHDAPLSITTPEGVTTLDNEFIWPTLIIGPSPVAGKRRVYVGARNYVSHAVNASPSENMRIAYADFNGDDIEMGTVLTWTYITIPEQDTWNHDPANLRRPAGTLVTDVAGNLYYAGHHFASDVDSNEIVEPDMDVWICPNYGQGTWTRVTDYSHIPTWNPPESTTSTVGYFKDENSVAFTNDALYWGIVNTGHFNAVIDNNNKIHEPGVWGLLDNQGTYFPAMQYVKEYVYDINTQTFEIRDIYPQKDPTDTFNQTFTPWDMEAPWGSVDEYLDDGAGGVVPAIATGWPFCHWDTTAHTDAMLFHYNGVRISDPNDEGQMVAIWQDSQRARWYNYYSDTAYAAYANTPEIMISVSDDEGETWSEPINLNNVDTPQFAGLKPMYVYPADKVIYTGIQNSHKVGKIGVMFYNDFTWGSNVNAPAYHPTPDGGETMFMELEIVFPGVANDDNTLPAVTNLLHQNYPNPFNPETTISFDMPKAGPVNLSIYNVKGELVKTLADSDLGFGRQSLVWNGTDNYGQNVTSGLYFYRLTANGHSESRKMMLLK